MDEALSAFYMNLPRPKHLPDFYLPGYTEALSYVQGVKVIPSYEFAKEMPYPYNGVIATIPFPCYYIPIKLGKAHYGFICKSYDKQTPRYSTYYPFFNLDALLDHRSYVFVVEGVKDAGIFLERGEPVISMLTSGMGKDHAKMFVEFKKTPIFLPDNDSPGRAGVREFCSHHAKRLKLAPCVVLASGHKDMGDYYLPDKRLFVERTFQKAIAVARSLPEARTLFGRS